MSGLILKLPLQEHALLGSSTDYPLSLTGILNT
jgi:hypothetical protein